MCGETSPCGSPSMALVIEEDPLTSWSVKRCLDASYKVQLARDFDDALVHLQNPDLRVLICGSPIVDGDPGVLERLAQNPDRTVIALVSDTSRPVPGNVIVVEKPFVLAHLARLLESHIAQTRR